MRSVVTLIPHRRGLLGMLGTEHPEFYADFLRSDRRAVEALYRSRGYLDARVRAETEDVRRGARDEVDIVLSVDEGTSTRVQDVHLAGVTVLPEGDVRRRLVIRPGLPFNETLIPIDRETIKNIYVERGHLLATIAPEIEYAPGAVIVTYAVREGPQMHFGSVATSDTSGTRRTRDVLIRRHFTFRSGETFRASAVSQTERSLYDTGLFTDVRFVTLARDSLDPTRVDMALQIAERKGRYVEGGLTYDASSELTASGEAGLTNVNGMNRRVTGSASLGMGIARVLAGGRVISKGTAKLSLGEPWVLGTRQRATATAFYDFLRDRQRFDLRTYTIGAQLDVRRELSRLTNLTLSMSNAWVHSDTAAGTSADPRDYQNRAVNLSFDRDRRDDFFNPRRGHVLAAQVRYSGFGGTTNFARGSVAATRYHRVLPTVVVAARVNAGRIEPVTGRIPLVVDETVYAVSRVDIPSRFRLGGSTTVRAYGEDEIGVENRFDKYILADTLRQNPGGLALLLANVEVRWSLNWRWSLVGFLDAGNVWDIPADVRRARVLPRPGKTLADEDVRYGMGLGLRVATPVGPLRVDHAWKIGRPAGDVDGTMWQVAIGQAF